jgi:metal-responsive CopG/Arc/MetJ family transcriptional regulator
MPTKLTRVALSLPDEVIAVLDRMGKITGAGRATLIREWLIEGLPMFQQLADAMEMASQQNIDAFKVMSESLEKASNLTGQLSLEMKKDRRAAMRKRNRKPAQEPPTDD